MTVTRKALRDVACRACLCVRYAAGVDGRFGGIMRAGTYYAIAAVLVLATLPMYRYIFQHARELDTPVSSAVAIVQAPAVVLAARSAPPSSGPPLMPGEECHGGFVFLVDGSSYRQAVGVGGRPVRCDSRGLLLK
ncbi:hypothetical protein [Rhodanobacter soli]|uniref:Uncharacterized protein n=1 Tax=Rhodanobacter soli TaxID=590609 RepID=A0ABV2PS25_9GAMM